MFFIGSFTRHGDLERYYKMGTGWEKKKVAFRHLHIDLGDLWFLLFRFLLFCSALSFRNPLACRGSPFGLYLSFLLFSSLYFFFDEFFITIGLAVWPWIPRGRAISKRDSLRFHVGRYSPVLFLYWCTRLLDEEEERGKKRSDASAPR